MIDFVLLVWEMFSGEGERDILNYARKEVQFFCRLYPFQIRGILMNKCSKKNFFK